jgi:uncharacterized protein
MEDDNFEWDDEKARRNLAKHDVAFELARLAFGDPNRVEFDDPDPHELRYNRLCMYQGVIYHVTYAETPSRIRIISARKANRHEQRDYFEGQT